MVLERDACYRALLSHDARFDGRFFVAVSSTRIYCRPVCRVKVPKRENCTFYPSAAAAESAGYRPCLRCRPELAPGQASVDAASRLARAAAGLIDDGYLTDASLDRLAARLAVTDRHLRRVFANEFGVSPIEYSQTGRLLLAKRLITDTSMPLTQVAMAAGFGSLRRFNTLFRSRYRLRPSDIRKQHATQASDTLEFALAYRPPYAWQAQLAFLRARAIAGVEEVDAKVYRRSVALEHNGKRHTGCLQVAHDARRSSLRVTLSASLARVVPHALGRVKRLFDLAAHPQEIDHVLGALATANPGLRVPGAFDGFEVAVRAILGQQITVRAATTLAGRFVARFGEPVDTPFSIVHHCFPAPQRIAESSASELGQLGIIGTRSRSIIVLARALADGTLALEPGGDIETLLAKLRNLPGIGEWTAQYIAMRALAWPDAFLHTDLGVMKAMGENNAKRVLALAECWRPWRAYAVIHLWKSLGH